MSLTSSLDFEGGIAVADEDDGQFARWSGSVPAACAGATAVAPTAGAGRLAGPVLQYQGGRAEQRRARVVADPLQRGNQVLEFWLQSPNVVNGRGEPEKARVQMNLAPNQALRQVRQTVRMYLPPSFETLRQFPKTIPWLTISEWWNNADWTQERFPFRISVNLVKTHAQPGSPLYFAVHAQTKSADGKQWNKDIWSQVNTAVEVVAGSWWQLDYRVVEGGASTGRFYLSVSRAGQPPVVLFDVTNFTHHPDDPAPDGFAQINPVKLYTSRAVVEFVRDTGAALQVHWDDLEMSACSAAGAAADVRGLNWEPCPLP